MSTEEDQNWNDDIVFHMVVFILIVQRLWNAQSKCFSPIDLRVRFPSQMSTCDRLRSTLILKNNVLPCAPRDCIMVNHPRRRFGNAFIAIHKAFHLAEMVGINEIHIPYGYALFQKSFKWNNISLIMDMDPITSMEECYSVQTYFTVPGVRNTTFDRSFKEAFEMQVSDVMEDIPDDSLSIHIRSGDIFGPRPHPGYGQPPCGYYREIIESRNWSEVLLFAEDRRNPCINVVLSYGAKHVLGRSLREEIGMLVSSKNLVIGRGTFGLILASISTKVRNLWTCGTADSSDQEITGRTVRSYGSSRQFDCHPSHEYVENVMGLSKWRNTKDQHQWMLNSSCVDWLVVEDSVSPENKGKSIKELRDAVF